MFKNRKLIIATKHQKETVIAPLLEKALGVYCFVDPNFDTDTFGTFSGEVERQQDPISTVRLKCLKAMELNNCDLGIASEGSFGPHPSLFFASAGDEFIIFIDKKNNLEIIARELSLETNFNGKDIDSEAELFEFSELAKFPSHHLILKKSKTDTTDMEKGIGDATILKETFNNILKKHGCAYVETDMRALFNPSRMDIIEIATKKLVEKIQSTCPECHTPGFGVTNVKQGLPCELCRTPTESTLSLIYTCQKCEFEKEEIHPNGKQTENPMYCNYCNP
jgi:hypothetical protein